MAVSIFDENTNLASTEFQPFDDSKVSLIRRFVQPTNIVNSGGLDTTIIDPFRQGISVTTQTQRFKGNGALIWAGNIKGYTSANTFGQALSFTEFENSKVFEELPRFNPVSFIEQGDNYPLPITLNEGPQQNKETIIEPFTIPFRQGLDTNEGAEPARFIRASIEDGNQDNRRLNGRNSRIEQFIDFRESNDFVPFLDDGVQYLFDTKDVCPRIDVPTVSFFTFNNSITDSKGLITLDFQSGSVSYDTGPETINFLSPVSTKKALAFGNDGTPHLSSSVYIPEIDVKNLSVQLLAFIPSSSLANLSTVPFGHVFVANQWLAGALKSLPYVASTFYIALTQNDGAPFDNRIMFLTGIGLPTGILDTMMISGSNFEDNINLDAWNHIAFTRGPSSVSGSTHNTRLFLNGTNVVNFDGTAAIFTGSNTEAKFSIGGLSLGTPGANVASGSSLQGIKQSCIKISNRTLTNGEIFDEASKVQALLTTGSNNSAILVPGFLNEGEGIITPFDDTTNKRLVNRLQTSNTTLIELLRDSNMDINLDEDIRERYDIKSATAGKDVYGPGQGYTGTDSIIFNGRLKGS